MTASHKCWISHVGKYMIGEGILLINCWWCTVTVLLVDLEICYTIYVLCWDSLLDVVEWMIDIPYHKLPSVQALKLKYEMKMFRWKAVSAGSGATFSRLWHVKDIKRSIKCCSKTTIAHHIISYCWSWSW